MNKITNILLINKTVVLAENKPSLNTASLETKDQWKSYPTMQDHTLFSIIYKTSDPVTGCQPKKISKKYMYIQTFCVWVSSWALVCANCPSRQDIRLSFVWVSWAIFCRVLSNSSHESESCWISLFKEEAEFFSSSTFLFCISSAYRFSQWLIFLNISTIKKLRWF